MKKILLIVAVAGLIVGTAGCGDLKNALDVTFDLSYSNTFTVQGNLATLSYDVNFEDNDAYRQYKDKIKSITIASLRYAITANTGGAGEADFYAGAYGSAFGAATKVARVSFAAGETRPETEVEWINKAYLESLLMDGKLSLWAVGSGAAVNIVMPVTIRVKIIANPLE
jgi:hypothetical protein